MNVITDAKARHGGLSMGICSDHKVEACPYKWHLFKLSYVAYSFKMAFEHSQMKTKVSGRA